MRYATSLPARTQHQISSNSDTNDTLFSAPHPPVAGLAAADRVKHTAGRPILGSHWPSRPQDLLSHHPSPSCRSGSPTSMSHRYRLADTSTLEQTAITACLKTEGWLLTSCSPPREVDPVNRRYVPRTLAIVSHLCVRDGQCQKRCCMPPAVLRAHRRRKSGSAHFVILHLYPTPGLLAAAPSRSRPSTPISTSACGRTACQWSRRCA